MFEPGIYAARRAALRAHLRQGLIVLAGLGEAPMNYPHNVYPFTQDGSFAYFFGLRQPDLIGLIDLDSGEDALFGPEGDLDSIVWTGPLPSLSERAAEAGVARTGTPGQAAEQIAFAIATGRKVHYPPPYRADWTLDLAELLGASPRAVAAGASTPLVRAIVALREIKAAEEVAEMERALEITAEMHGTAMALSRPGVHEREVVGAMEGIARSRDWRLAYPAIFSKRGEVLHNGDHSGRLTAGDLVVNDSGASSEFGYASDITRTLPIGGFSPRQRDLYEIVLTAQLAAIKAVRPGARYLDVHKLAMRSLVEGMGAFGVFKGDPAEVVESGAYAVVHPSGLGHQIGLDVHDMEALGEDRVGYDEEVSRSSLFGLNRLRLAKRLKTGMTLTVEPGLYFIPPLIEAWAAERRFDHFIDYERLRTFVGAGGLRIEDDVLVTADCARVLGPPIAKSVADVDAAMLA